MISVSTMSRWFDRKRVVEHIERVEAREPDDVVATERSHVGFEG